MRDQVNKFLGCVLIGLMIVMTLDVLWGVFTRYTLGSQASWTEELARYLLIWVGILGAAYTSGLKQHLAIDLLSPSLSEKFKLRVFRLINLLIILFAFFVLIIGGFRLLYLTQTLGQASAALQIPMTLVYAVIPISGLLIIYYKLSDLLNGEVSFIPESTEA